METNQRSKTPQNLKNRKFYAEMSPAYLRTITRTAGLDTGADIAQIWKLISPRKNLLDIGAGTGRAIRFLRRAGFRGDITAVERSPNFLKELTAYKTPNTRIISSDIGTLKLQPVYDCALWLFSGITDFHFGEQSIALDRIAGALQTKGLLIIESVLPGETNNGRGLDPQTHVIETNFAKWKGYVPNETEIQTYCSKLGLRFLEARNYLSPTGRRRVFYILEKR